jgi:hypothetical protein
MQYANSPKYRAFFSSVMDCDVLTSSSHGHSLKPLSTLALDNRSNQSSLEMLTWPR